MIKYIGIISLVGDTLEIVTIKEPDKDVAENLLEKYVDENYNKLNTYTDPEYDPYVYTGTLIDLKNVKTLENP